MTTRVRIYNEGPETVVVKDTADREHIVLPKTEVALYVWASGKPLTIRESIKPFTKSK